MSKEKTWKWFMTRLDELGYKSLSQFASTKGYQKSSLSRYFHQQRVMPADTLCSVAKALKVSPVVLLVALGHLK
jgi:transcriptional regulator with XRE-family HTH domain